jgi:hypothetical protein
LTINFVWTNVPAPDAPWRNSGRPAPEPKVPLPPVFDVLTKSEPFALIRGEGLANAASGIS